jgi:hypothetical protein
MAVSVKQLKARFTEFNDTPNDVISLAIAEATRSVNAGVFGTRANDAITWLACDLIATSPRGEHAKLISKDGTTVYYMRYKKIEKAVTLGLRYV